jgi:iron complex outermembrane receptor protein
MALAIGADLHRDTTRTTSWRSSEFGHLRQQHRRAHGEGARNVAGLYAELDAPVTKKLTSTSPPATTISATSATPSIRRPASATSREDPDVPRFGQHRLPRPDPVRPLRLPHRRRQRHHLRPLGRSGAVPGRHAGHGRHRHRHCRATSQSEVCNAQLPRRSAATPNLQPEKSRGWTLGVVIEPVKNATVSLRLLEHPHEDMLANLPEQVYFLNPVKYADLFVRNPDGSLAYVNNTTMNLGGQKAAGIDVSASYTFPRTPTALQAAARRHLPDPVRQPARARQRLRIEHRPLRPGQQRHHQQLPDHHLPLEAHPALNWNRRLGAQLTQNYNSKYEDQNWWRSSTGATSIRTSVWNLTASYNGFRHVNITAGVTNLFDTRRRSPTIAVIVMVT